MKILILGGSGFLGQKLARALIARGRLSGREISELVLADRVLPDPLDAPFPLTRRMVDITDREAVETLFEGERPEAIYHLAAVVSGQAETDFDLGMAVNLLGTLHVFEAARRLTTCPLTIFTSSIAVYGGEIPQPIEDWTALNPQTSYGAQKAAAEQLLNDYSRKGFLDGRGLRLPTISIRPGQANKAASSFMSSIFREPLQGQEAICPVDPDYTHWYLSPRRCIENLIHAAEIPAADWGQNRCLALPGRSHRIGDMVEAMTRIAGPAPTRLIRWEPDPDIQKIVLGWCREIDARKALGLGFVADESFEENIRFFLEDDIDPAAARHPRDQGESP